jgi:excinuclease ABC subunit C
VGPRTKQRLIEHFGSVRGIRQASRDALTAVVSAATAEKICKHFAEEGEAGPAPALHVIS